MTRELVTYERTYRVSDPYGRHGKARDTLDEAIDELRAAIISGRKFVTVCVYDMPKDSPA